MSLAPSLPVPLVSTQSKSSCFTEGAVIFGLLTAVLLCPNRASSIFSSYREYDISLTLDGDTGVIDLNLVTSFVIAVPNNSSTKVSLISIPFSNISLIDCACIPRNRSTASISLMPLEIVSTASLTTRSSTSSS